jgi:hypothetical protein
MLTHRWAAFDRGGSDGSADSGTSTLRQFLQSSPRDALCDACLAFALEISLERSQALTDALSKQSLAFPRAGQACARCRRQMFAIGYARRNVAKFS